MKKITILAIMLGLCLFTACQQKEKTMTQDAQASTGIRKATIQSVIDELSQKNGSGQKGRIIKGVEQVAGLWNTEVDGNENEFRDFCITHYEGNSVLRQELFNALQTDFEVLFGHFNKISLDLKRAVHLEGVPVTSIDEMMAGYEPYANLVNDLFANKVGFVVALNFPYYTLEEKSKFEEENKSRLDWAYARLGDIFTSRVPSELNQKYAKAVSDADYYISNYNIYMGYLVDNNKKRLFPEDMKLISHWNLRDELKANYGQENGLNKQKMIFEVMQHIIKQDIPKEVINSSKYTWNPITNKIFKDGKEVKVTPEPNTRYQYLLNSFVINKEIDKYRSAIGNLINQTFDVQYEMPQPEVETLFKEYISSDVVKQVAEIIKQRLGRDLQPFDIWYDGFKTRSTLDQVALDKITRAKYSNTTAFQKDIPRILQGMGFSKNKAEEIASRIDVDAAKGAGHAWGADMKGEKAHLRTRIAKTGMDYKGYNIAIHELGHNVEQTLSLYDVDNWFMRGVPNTAFTEAWAFTFQAQDLRLLGIKNVTPDEDMEILDKFWACYEIMGVSLVDQGVWKWMYEHPDCNAAELKDATIAIAKDVWNKYYEPVLGHKDCLLLAIYSHMIDNPLYLSAYPIGHLIEFQMHEYMKGKNIGSEMYRICTLGRLTPDIWMKHAVGDKVSVKPLIEATRAVITKNNK